jgi:hypothetical protein
VFGSAGEISGRAQPLRQEEIVEEIKVILSSEQAFADRRKS